MTKEEKLHRVAAEIAQCSICRENAIGLPVPGEGNADAKVLFVGEAPGKQEAATGRPFIGRSGKLLRGLIAEIGLKDSDIFITSIGKYLPFGKTLSAEQISHSRKYLLQQINIIKPKIIVLLGAVAIQGVFQKKIPVRKVHGTIREGNGYIFFFTLHPAAALRFLPLRKELENDFQKLHVLLNDVL